MNFLGMMTDPFDATMAQIDFEARMGVSVRYRTFPDFSLPFEVEALTEERDDAKQELEGEQEASDELTGVLRAAIEWYETPKRSKAGEPEWLKDAKALV